MVFGSVVAGPGGAGAVPLLAGPTGASYNEIHPICAHPRPFAVKNPPFRPSQPRCDPFFTIFRPSRPQIRRFRQFHPPTRSSGAPKTGFSGCLEPARPRAGLMSRFRLPRPPLARSVGESGPFSAGCHPELVEGSRPSHTVAPLEFRRELSTPALRACAQVDPSSPSLQSKSASLCPFPVDRSPFRSLPSGH